MTGTSWDGVTMSAASTPVGSEVTEFLSSLAYTQVQNARWTDRLTGIAPALSPDSEIDSAYSALSKAGWPEQPAADGLEARDVTLSSPIQLPALRIAETRRCLPLRPSGSGGSHQLGSSRSVNTTAARIAIVPTINIYAPPSC